MAVNSVRVSVRVRLRTTGAAALAAGALMLGGCGGGGSGTASGVPPTSPGPAGPLTVATSAGGVRFLADRTGRALYLFEKDVGGESACTAACATTRPPLAAPATAGPGVTGRIASTSRADGITQVVYNGHPLYRYPQDTGPAQTNGEGLNVNGGAWYLLDPSGNPLTSLGDDSPPGMIGGY